MSNKDLFRLEVAFFLGCIVLSIITYACECIGLSAVFGGVAMLFWFGIIDTLDQLRKELKGKNNNN